ncbi:MAG TPA: sigma factor-like helix-turn-helix DNA-binding protein [Mycobacteriales bacterium]|nr:sigma factor-like helix-turn-helix DNA-binding protein [Mycobacteriales bacterium]
MSRDVALVSADDFTAAVRVYADRVHDLLRRGGVGASDAARIEEDEALAMLAALRREPDTVADLAGWWFARALSAVDGTTTDGAPAGPGAAASVLAGSSGESGVRAALATLPPVEREAVLLRDAYDLPLSAVAVALGIGDDQAREIVTAGRLHLVAAYDDRTPPDLWGHVGRTVVTLVGLNGVADGSMESRPAALLRRHLISCPACDDVVETLGKGRRLAAGLPIIAMPDEAREQLLDLVAVQATKRLPSPEKLQRMIDSDIDPAPLVPPLLVVLAIALAVALGLGLALLTQASSA